MPLPWKRWIQRLRVDAARPPADLNGVGTVTFQTTGPVTNLILRPPGPTYRPPSEPTPDSLSGDTPDGR